ncbi:22958_t:CDS:2, partial [Entrophospora sp. SA101]
VKESNVKENQTYITSVVGKGKFKIMVNQENIPKSNSQSGKIVKIEKIRPDHEDLGIKDFEVSFLRLLEKATNGSSIEISYT